MKKRHFQVKEAVGISQTSRQVDRDAGVIRGVQVCGPMSRNGRDYSQAIEKAVKLYEGTKVNIDHGFEPGQERAFESGFGVIRNARREGNAIYGDLHFLKSHDMAEKVCERAERFPETFGLSHDADIDGYMEDGIFHVTEITAVRSVDLVGDPATARGIFESERKTTMKKTFRKVLESAPAAKVPGRKKVLEAMDDMMVDDMPVSEMDVEVPDGATSDDAIKAAFKAAVAAVMDDDSLDVAAKKKRLGDLVTMEDKLSNPDTATTDAPVVEEEMTDEEKKKDETAMESFRKSVLSDVRKAIKSELVNDARQRMAESVLESAGEPSDSPMLAQLVKLKTRAEMEDHIASEFGGSFQTFGGRGMATYESASERNQPRDPNSILTRIGCPTN